MRPHILQKWGKKTEKGLLIGGLGGVRGGSLGGQAAPSIPGGFWGTLTLRLPPAHPDSRDFTSIFHSRMP